MTPGSRYVQLLTRNQPNYNNGTVAGGLAHMLQQGLMGYSARQDQQQQAEANKALLQGLQAKPWTNPDTGQTAPGTEGGLQGAANALAGLGDNPYAGPLSAELMMQQARAQAEAEARRQELALKARFDRENADYNETLLRNRPMTLSPGQTLYDPKAGANIASGGMDLPAGFTTGQDGNATFIPGGPADPQVIAQNELLKNRFLPVPGVGVFDRVTGTYVGAGQQPQPSGSALPQPQGDPTKTLPPAHQGAAKADEIRAATAEIAKMREELKGQREIETLAERFLQLQGEQDTGGILRSFPLAQTFEGLVDPQIQEMGAIQDRMTPLMRGGFPGAASDADREMFRGAAFGTDKSPEVNRNLIAGFKAAAQNARDRLDFFEAYVGQNGTLRGAEAAWSSYLNANPIFDGQSKSPALNKGRRSWKEFFGPAPAQSSGKASGNGWSVERID